MSNVTSPKGRKSMEVSESFLRSAVEAVESNGPVESLAVLYKLVSKKYAVLTQDEENLQPISSTMAEQRIKALNIPHKTVAEVRVATAPAKKSAKTVILAALADVKSAIESGDKDAALSALASAIASVESLHARKPEVSETETAAA